MLTSQSDHEPAGRANYQWFATTHWSVVLAAKQCDAFDMAVALEKLCRLCLLFLAIAATNTQAAVPVNKDLLAREAESIGKPAWRPMLRYLATLHKRATHPPSPPFAFPWEDLGPGYGYGPAFGSWDEVHIMLDELPAWPEHVREQLLNDLRLQLTNGFLPGTIWMPASPSAPGAPPVAKNQATYDGGTQGHPPVWVVAADDYLRLAPDYTLQRECSQRLIRQIGWFETNRRVEAGGFFYNDILLQKWESGIDDCVRFDKTESTPKACIDATSHV